MQRKLEYYKNLKPRAQIFHTKEKDPNDKIAQDAFKKNQLYLENRRKKKLADRTISLENPIDGSREVLD